MNEKKINQQRKITTKNFFVSLILVLLPLVIVTFLWIRINYCDFCEFGITPLGKEIISRKFTFAFGVPPISLIFFVGFLIGVLLKFRTCYFEELRKITPLRRTYIILFLYATFFMHPSGLTHAMFRLGSLDRTMFFLKNLFIVILILQFIEIISNFNQWRREVLTLKVRWSKYIITVPFWYLITAYLYIFSFFVGVE